MWEFGGRIVCVRACLRMCSRVRVRACVCVCVLVCGVCVLRKLRVQVIVEVPAYYYAECFLCSLSRQIQAGKLSSWKNLPLQHKRNVAVCLNKQFGILLLMPQAAPRALAAPNCANRLTS